MNNPQSALKTVVKLNEMEEDMLNYIQGCAYESFVIQKVKYKDEMV